MKNFRSHIVNNLPNLFISCEVLKRESIYSKREQLSPLPTECWYPQISKPKHLDRVGINKHSLKLKHIKDVQQKQARYNSLRPISKYRKQLLY